MAHRKCWICKQNYPLTEEFYYANKSKPDGWGTECRSCHKERGQRKRASVKREFVLSHGNTCANCGLYHEDHKFFDIDHIVPLEQTGEKRKQYIYDTNSQVLCPNCHRLKTIKERKWGKYEQNTNL